MATSSCCCFGKRSAQIQPVLVAGDDHIVIPYGYFISGVSLSATEKADGVECYFKLWTGTYEGASHWLHLQRVAITNPATLGHGSCQSALIKRGGLIYISEVD